jgi:hypothetical protein
MYGVMLLNAGGTGPTVGIAGGMFTLSPGRDRTITSGFLAASGVLEVTG